MAKARKRLAPRKKVAAGGAGSAFGLALVALLGAFGVEVTPELGVALAGVLSFLAGYLTPAPAEVE